MRITDSIRAPASVKLVQEMVLTKVNTINMITQGPTPSYRNTYGIARKPAPTAALKQATKTSNADIYCTIFLCLIGNFNLISNALLIGERTNLYSCR